MVIKKEQQKHMVNENEQHTADVVESQDDVMESQDDVMQADDASNDPILPSHFEPIPEEKLKKAKKVRRVLWVILIILLVILLGTAAGAVYYYLNYGEPTAHVETTPVEIEDTTNVQDRGTTATTEMPQLASMFGKTPEQVVEELGSDYLITKTEVSTGEEDAEEGTADAADATEETSAQKITAMATISYSPEDDGSGSTTQVQNIYLSLNEQGVVVEVYFVSSMGILDYPISSFSKLVETKDSFVESLANAGVTVAAETEYTLPVAEDYTEYVDPEASILKIKKQTVSFKGALVSEQAPTQFEITYTYDYGVTGMEEAPDMQPAQRMLYIKLS